MSANNLGRKNSILNALKKGAVLIVPFLLFFIAAVSFSVWGVEYLIADSVIYRTLFNQAASSDTDKPTSSTNIHLSGYAPTVDYGCQWATLNVEGWERKDIPIIAGDDIEALKKGGGHWIGSRYCGENGKIVICAHVTSYFKELENSKIGDMVTMKTIFGDGEVYGYKVKDIVIFDYRDSTLLHPADGEETLILYTCYPLKNNGKKRVQRIALVCEKVYGRMWAEE